MFICYQSKELSHRMRAILLYGFIQKHIVQTDVSPFAVWGLRPF